jgi:hypothetical protein
MEILEAYDLAGTLRGAALLAGCDHKTVAHWVAVRDREGGMRSCAQRRPARDGFAEKIDELVDRSHGKIRADASRAATDPPTRSSRSSKRSDYPDPNRPDPPTATRLPDPTRHNKRVGIVDLM